MKKAVVLLSGGLDSATTLFIARHKKYKCYPLIFDYGQRHKKEIKLAGKIAGAAGLKGTVLNISLPWKRSALLDKKQRIPKKRTPGKIPSTYVPARNTVFLSFALSFAEAISAEKIFLGVNSVDYSGYPDCRENFLKAFDKVIEKGTKAGIEGRNISVEAPLLFMTKKEIIKKGTSLKVPYELTWSCYEGKKYPCNMCDSCIIRKKGFEDAGIMDPFKKYEKRKKRIAS